MTRLAPLLALLVAIGLRPAWAAEAAPPSGVTVEPSPEVQAPAAPPTVAPLEPAPPPPTPPPLLQPQTPAETPSAEQSPERELVAPPRLPTRFGDEGEMVFSGALSASLSHLGYDTSSDSTTSFSVEPAFDYFSDRDFSEGASAFFRYSDHGFGPGESYTNIAYGATAQLGFNLRLGERASLWLKGGVGLWQSRTSYTYQYGGTVTINATPIVLGPSTEVTENALFVEVAAPFLFHLAQHFFVGIGPSGYVDLINTTNGVSNKRRSLGVSSTVGGWF